MSNRLEMLKSCLIKALGEAGGEREVVKVLGASRGAVWRYLGRKEAKRTTAPTGDAPRLARGDAWLG